MAATGGKDDAIRKLFEEAGDGGGAIGGTVEEVETKFEETLAGLSLVTSVVEESPNVWQAQRDTYAR
jgi:hypothetical protein